MNWIQNLLRHRAFVLTLVATVFGMLNHTAGAAIISTTGSVVVATPPADISRGAWESNTQIRAIVEQQKLALPASVSVDISVPGTSPGAVDENLSPLQIPAGTLVNSYELHMDIVGDVKAQNAKELSGSITFSNDIIGLIALSDSLNATTGVLGLPGVIYASGPDHGVGFIPAGSQTSDTVTLSADRRTVTVDFQDAGFPDELRVVTAVPEPASAILFLSAVGALALAPLLRSRRRAA